MITRIEITNFMSHKHTVIEPAAGLTVLVGPNNCGKSAVVAALQILCHNDNSTYVQRHGERECSVKIETDDGHTVEWRRKNTPSYVIDGQTFDRLRGSGLPDELHKVLRLPTVDADGDTDFDIHFGTQKSPIFLIGGSAANAARFFASSSDAIRLVEMQRRHKDKLANAHREKNRLEAESKQLNAELEAIEPVVDLDHRLETATSVYDEVLRCNAWLDEAGRHETAMRAQSAVLAQCSARAGTLRPLLPPSEVLPVEPLDTLIAAMVTAENQHASTASRAAALAGLLAPPEPVLTRPLTTQIAAIELEEGRQKAASFRSGTLGRLEPPPELFDVVSLARMTKHIGSLSEDTEHGEEQRRLLAGLSSPPQLADADTLGRLVERLISSARQHAIAEQRSAALGTISQPPRPVDESELADLLISIEKTTAQIGHWKEASATLCALSPVPIHVETGAVSDFLSRLDGASSHVSKCTAASQTTAADLAAAAESLRSQAAGNLCPICGSPLDPEQIVALAAAGLGGHEHG
jgi:exonuclease SbcC